MNLETLDFLQRELISMSQTIDMLMEEIRFLKLHEECKDEECKIDYYIDCTNHQNVAVVE